MEPLDLVDAHDNIIGIAMRDEVHRKELLHRGICVLIFDPDGRIFVQKRSPKKDVFPGLYEAAVCGHVLSGEAYHQAAVRELREELGIVTTPAKVKEITRFGHHEEKERMLVTLYSLKDYHGRLDQELLLESKGRFVDTDKLRTDIKTNPQKFRPGMAKALSLFFELDGEPRAFVNMTRTNLK